MKDWALILGASSGFGAATAKKLAAEGINIFGVHLDRRSAHNDIQNLINELKKNNVNVVFKNIMSLGRNIYENEIVIYIKNLIFYSQLGLLDQFSISYLHK